MDNKKDYLAEITDRLQRANVDEKTVAYVIGLIKYSFKNGVKVGKRQATQKAE